MSSRVFNLLLRYRDSKFFQMINRHQNVAMVLLVLWGMFIIILFMYFVISIIPR